VVPGLFSIGEAGLSESIEWTITGFRKAWTELESRGMVTADWAARVVWIPNALQHTVEWKRRPKKLEISPLAGC
jgi:hypothetical protein